jgi:hypothetical protein
MAWGKVWKKSRTALGDDRPGIREIVREGSIESPQEQRRAENFQKLITLGGYPDTYRLRGVERWG